MILWFSLAACLLVSFYLPVLGQQILQRRIIFVDLALAQVAAVGYAVGMAVDGNGMLYAAVITAGVVVLLALFPDKSDLPKEAVMGALYALAVSIGMMVLAMLPHAEGQMMELMFGSVLGVNETELMIMAVAGAVALLLSKQRFGDHLLGRIIFYGSLAIAVVPAIYAVGVILVFAMLVMPGLSVWRDGNNGSALQTVAVAAVASVCGIIFSDYFDYPPSSAVVVFLAAISLIWRGISKIKNR
ncbi:metal ABC transporter permease [Mariprofundus sp. EBB-1]|uniref:metal ABC transporter permease n=1 Tax=Mariprofundus sp. EBB-1 TaxID=2650971 RepID=UPI000EF1A3D3|nr:metal ABC transporter permease [Mariprofundus sp. EBB-1]RLL52236.1 metal ABC transporter permease [Mariprofundus sp. EBB-1]